jgi:hypothetical protein
MGPSPSTIWCSGGQLHFFGHLCVNQSYHLSRLCAVRTNTEYVWERPERAVLYRYSTGSYTTKTTTRPARDHHHHHHHHHHRALLCDYDLVRVVLYDRFPRKLYLIFDNTYRHYSPINYTAVSYCIIPAHVPVRRSVLEVTTARK